MRMFDNTSDQKFWVKALCLIRDHSPTHSHNGSKQSQVKEHGPVSGDFQPQEQLLVEDRDQSENCRK
jgi:hypothetical protein